MDKKIVYVKNKNTGGHFCFQNEGSKLPFTNNMTECRSVKLLPTDIVADMGAYVGEFSILAMKSGVKKVYSYEPTPDTFEVLKKNVRPNMNPINAAVVGDNAKTIDLYISSGIGVTNSIAKKARKKESIKVKAIKYEEALKDANVVKIDVEGAEYGFNIIQPQLRVIILEFHPIVGKNWQRKAFEIMSKIEQSGFIPIMKPKFKNGWDVSCCYVKK